MNGNLPRPMPPPQSQGIYQTPAGSGYEEENPYMQVPTVLFISPAVSSCHQLLVFVEPTGFNRREDCPNSSSKGWITRPAVLPCSPWVGSKPAIRETIPHLLLLLCLPALRLPRRHRQLPQWCPQVLPHRPPDPRKPRLPHPWWGWWVADLKLEGASSLRRWWTECHPCRAWEGRLHLRRLLQALGDPWATMGIRDPSPMPSRTPS